MCGIAGFVSFGGHARDDAAARVKRMADRIRHRGPDAEGFHVDDHIAFGHRRLAIIDVASGQQPMAALGGAVQLVFNGEIYNFPEVRAELEALGHVFQTHSDTEVILLGYLQWGEQCVERLNGMFAFAIWDARSHTLLLARDRVGEKPLYWWRDGDTLAFASELKALRAGGLCPDEIDPEALDCYFTLGYIPSPRSIYRGVHKLRAAHTLVASATGERQRRYWTLECGEERPRGIGEVVEEFEALLDDAVRCRLMSEVPLGAFLSGGIDSSLVVSSMARILDRPVVTNSIGFDEREYSELPVAAAIAKHLGTDHHEFVVKPDAVDVLEKIAWHFDEPLADSSAVPTWYVCEMARRTCTVVLSGDGGDEGFAGYTFRYIPHVVESRIRAQLPPAARSALFGPLGAAWPASAWLPRPLRLKTILENLAVSDAEAYYRDLAWLRPDTRDNLYAPDFLRSLQGFTPRETVDPYYRHNGASTPLGRAQYADIHVYMTDDVLAKVDRMSMAHALEVRCPLLDPRILEFGARLPRALRTDARRGKLVLRGLAERRVPAQVLNMPKRGFSIPAAQWLRTQLRPQVEAVLGDAGSRIRELLDPAVTSRLWQEHTSGARDHSVFLWGLLSVGLWDQARDRSKADVP